MYIEINDDIKLNRKNYVRCKCSVCGYIGEIRRDHLNNGVGCPVCANKVVCVGVNDLATTRPDLVSVLKNPEDAKYYTQFSHKKVDVACKQCGYETTTRVSDLARRGFHCPVCYGGFSFPSRVVAALLQNANILFSTEQIFKWSGKYRYDFYVEASNLIIEVHGRQHYVDVWKQSYTERQRIDELKRRLAFDNGIKFYISIDARESSFEYIQSSIKRSGLLELLGITKVDWVSVQVLANQGIAEESLRLWNQYKNVSIISQHLGISADAIRGYLKSYQKLGLCNYNPKLESKIGNRYAAKRVQRKIRCIDTGEVFESIRQAARKYNICETGIQNCAAGRTKTSGAMHWEYIK